MIKAQGGIRKSGILSPWRNPLAPGDRFYRRVSAITRAIMNFNGTQYAVLSEPVVLDGDFEIEFFVYPINVSGSDEILLGKSDDQRGFIRISQGHIHVNMTTSSGATIFNALPALVNNEIQRIVVSRSGSDITVNYAGESETIYVADLSNHSFDWIAAKSGSSLFQGNFFSTRIWNNGDRNTGELVTDLRFDEPDTNYQRNYAVPLGSEMWTAGNYDSVNVPAWSTIVSQTLLSVAGRCYEVSMDVSVDSGSLHIVNFSGYPNISESGRYSYVVHAKNTGQFVIQSMGNGFAGSIRNVSIKERSSAILENTLPGDWEEISKKSGDDFWTGDGGRVIEYAEGAL